MAEESPLILDTCAMLWLASGDKKLSNTAVGAINQAPVVFVSAITGFEIAIKVAKKKLQLPLPPAAWFVDVLEHHDLTVLPLTVEICIEAAQLPPIHIDPCDRFIIAAARLNKWTVVTADTRFEKYDVPTIT